MKITAQIKVISLTGYFASVLMALFGFVDFLTLVDDGFYVVDEGFILLVRSAFLFLSSVAVGCGTNMITILLERAFAADIEENDGKPENR